MNYEGDSHEHQPSEADAANAVEEAGIELEDERGWFAKEKCKRCQAQWKVWSKRWRVETLELD